MEYLFRKSILEILTRDLESVKSELMLYSNEEVVWKVSGEIKNPGGNLCLHICGNLQHFIGNVLGQSGFVRNRDAEFTLRGIPRNDLYLLIDRTILTTSSTLSQIKNETLLELYPLEVLGYPTTTLFFLTHLCCHLNYHLGQINYHRRLVCD